MRRFFRALITAAAAGATFITLGLAAAPAGAAVHYRPFSISGTTNDTNGEAGYFVNDASGWRIRDAHGSVTVTAGMKDLNGTATGAVGAELCDPDNGFAGQLGLIWNSVAGAFQARYADGYLPGSLNSHDPCIDNGLVTNPLFAPKLLTGLTIDIGDVLTFDVYYNTTYHVLQFTATDVTQDISRQASAYVGWVPFYEAGLGVLSGNLPALTPPASDPVAAFTGCNFTNYGAPTGSHSVLGGWDTRQAQTINGGSQVILSPDTSLNGAGNGFTVYEGGII
jgi:hypothetical protein